ncbi:hypothetical protein [Bradyrhizobium sp. RD5-C2]|uniref:hypothetical protein n=1 Tax=Bradyrhizobium sp. RD5-C2 TaxID=244562 RepID=UPI001CC72FCF|nr:hypothetical protein [Bradyrhizobium sp. RD5-C2]
MIDGCVSPPGSGIAASVETKGLSMVRLTDEIWSELVSSCLPPPKSGKVCQLPPESRQEVESALADYAAGDKMHLFNRITPETREALERTRKDTKRLSTQLTILKARQDFDRIAKAFGEPTINSHLMELDTLAAILDCAVEGLQFRSRNKTWMRTMVGVLFVELLKIRSYYLKIDVPNQAKETSSSGAFREYLKICLKQAEPLIGNDDLEEMLKQGLEYVVETFQFYKKDEDHCWEWHEIFPESEENLMKSSKIWRD